MFVSSIKETIKLTNKEMSNIYLKTLLKRTDVLKNLIF